MPTYDYLCEACGHEFELFQSMSDKPAKKCPECGKMKAKRQLSGGGAIIFKGSGFYSTDYRSKSYSDAAAKDKPAEKKSDSSKSDPKPGAS